METGEDDDVFNAPLNKVIKQEPKTEDSVRSNRKRSKSGSLTVTIEGSNINTDGAAPANQSKSDKSCKHHSSLLLQLSCIIQVVAIQCPTAFINVSLTSKGGRESVSKATTPLDRLPLRLSEMPLPKKGAEKKVSLILKCFFIIVLLPVGVDISNG